MKKIAFEEHYLTESMATALKTTPGVPSTGVARGNSPFTPKLLDVGEGRLQQMSADGVDMQVLSMTQPGVQVFEPAKGVALAKEANDQMAEVIKRHSDRFVGLASIAPQDPKAAADELERAVTKLGYRGANINSNVFGEYLDEKKFWPIFEQAEKLDVPIYIHPRLPSPDMIKPYQAYPGLSDAMIGFAAEVSLHALRLICSGLFDEYPKLKIVIGHMGEALPYWLWRIDNHFSRTDMTKRLKRLPSQYFKENFYITTSGMFFEPALLCAYLVLGAERILFAVDYPYEAMKPAVDFIDAAAISDIDKEKICHGNAEKLLKIK